MKNFLPDFPHTATNDHQDHEHFGDMAELRSSLNLPNTELNIRHVIPPRIMILEDDKTFVNHLTNKSNHSETDKKQYFDIVLPANRIELVSEPLLQFETPWFRKCESIVDLPIRPTCNSIHELDASLNFIDNVLSMDGSWRSVLKVNNEAILKALHIHREFDNESFQKHEMDNGVMERLTPSPYIVSSFGFCGQSVMTEFAHMPGRLVAKDKTLKNIERLRLARDLSRGLAELHSLKHLTFDQTPQSSSTSKKLSLLFAHHDINLANVVSTRPKTIQWNDFNLGIISKTIEDDRKKTSCQVPIRYRGDLWRSPEEIRNATPGTLPNVQPCDIYSFGSVLFQIMTKHQPWTHLEEIPQNIPNLTIVAKSKLEGKSPNLPEKYLPTSLEMQVLWKAIEACTRLEPLQRPSALQLAQGFHTAYQWTKNEIVRIENDELERLFVVS
jgi:hypothetical protein